MSKYSLEYYHKNREHINKRSRKWALAHPKEMKAFLRKSRKSFPERHLLNIVRNRAKKRGLAFDLTLQDIIIPTHCPYLGIELSVFGNLQQSPSIDRIDNSKGYIVGNIEVISRQANIMKNVASIPELQRFAQAILQKFPLG